MRKFDPNPIVSIDTSWKHMWFYQRDLPDLPAWLAHHPQQKMAWPTMLRSKPWLKKLHELIL